MKFWRTGYWEVGEKEVRVKKSSGFSLLEMMLVVGILGMLMVGGLAGYRGFNRRQQLRNAGLQLVASLREVRQRAISGVKRCEACQFGDTCGDIDDYQLDWWGLRWGSDYGLDEATYVYVGSCGEEWGNPEFPPEDERVVCGFASGVCFESPISGGVRFAALAGRVLEGAGVIDLCGGGRVYRVRVEASGRIVDEGLVEGESCGECGAESVREGCLQAVPTMGPASTPVPTATPTAGPTSTPVPTATPTVGITPFSPYPSPYF